MQLVPGTRLGLYEIVGLLGAGGMGEVYRAIDSRLDRQVAIKVLPEAVHADPERTARFEREAKLLASLNHQNIASIHGLEHSNGEQFIVMELVEGETLADQIARGPIPVLEALQIAKHIADALEAAHERGIVHRDLKPANVKVRPNGTVKVLDFGLAKALGGDPLTSPGTLTNSPTITSPVDVTGVGTLLGTAAYMAPEQARGKPVDKRADIWAFGCVLFEMVTSRRAFPGDDVSQTLARVIEREPDWDALPSGISTAIRLFLQRCLAKDPARRIRDIGDMRLALDGAFDAGVASPPGATFPSRIRRHALPWAAGLALSAVSGLAVWQLRPVASAPVTRFELPLPNSGSSPGGHPVSISPDGQSVFYVENLDGRSRILRRDLADLSWNAVPGTDGAETAPFFQPDGRSMGFVTDSGRAIRAVPRSGGSVLPVVRTADSIYSPVWAPNGTIIFGSNTGIWRVAAGGSTAELLAKTNVTAAGAHVLPGGERVMFHVNAGGTAGEAYSIEVLTIATGERRKITDGMYPLYAAGHLIFIRSNNSVWSIPFDVDRAEPSGSPAPIPLNIFRRAGDVPLALGNNGTLVYIPGLGTVGHTLTWVDARGNEKPTDISGENYISPRLSPDGKKLAVGTRAGDIWVIDLERSTRTKIASSDRGGTHRVSDITAWTPDSLRVTFNGVSQDLAAPTAPTLDWRLADASLPAEMIIRSEGTPTSWAHNGTALAYSCPQAALGGDATPNASANRDICVVQRSSTITASPWLATPANEQAPMFSPDGRWIAYVSDDSGQNQVYVQSYPGPGQRHTISRDGGVEPVWARNGRDLFYRSANKMMAVSMGEGPSVALGPPRVVFDRPFVRDASNSGAYPTYDVSADGRFLMVALRSPDRLVVVQSWLEELKRLVPTK